MQLKNKIPDMEENIRVIQQLMVKTEEGGSMTTHFELADAVMAKAVVEPQDLVCLWLGANVMLEYTYEQAIEMLETNLGKATLKNSTYDDDLTFIREQIIVTEVNIARIYNHSVRLKRKMVDTSAKVSGACAKWSEQREGWASGASRKYLGIGIK